MHMSSNVILISNPSALLMQETRQTEIGIYEGISLFYLYRLHRVFWRQFITHQRMHCHIIIF